MDSREDRRKEILDAAARLLSHYGVRKTTVADIARETGIGTGSVYLEFPSKDAIVCGLASRAHEDMLGQLRQTLEGGGALPDRVVAFFTTRTAMFRSTCSRGQHASELLRCASTSSTRADGAGTSPWEDFLAGQRALLTACIDDPRLVKGILLAYAAFVPPRPEVNDDVALDAVHELVRRALR